MIRVYFVTDRGDHWVVTDGTERLYLTCIADLMAGDGGLYGSLVRMVEL